MAPGEIKIMVMVDTKQLMAALEAARPKPWSLRLWIWFRGLLPVSPRRYRQALAERDEAVLRLSAPLLVSPIDPCQCPGCKMLAAAKHASLN